VAGLGGTIAMAGDGGVVPALSARQVVDAVPALAGTGVELEVHSLCNRPGASVTFDDLRDLRALLAGRPFAGAVITQGTDTIEETAYFLDLLHERPEPIVVTGAMRNPTLAGADGPANLLAAVLVAASPRARDLGCLVVMSDEIHAAARVRKTHSSSVSAFASPNGGPLGYLTEGRVRIVNRPASRFTFPAAPAGPLPRVAVHAATLGDDGDLLPGLAEHLDGLVVAGFGVGHVPETWVAHLAAAARRIPVVLASRTGAGSVGTRTYGFPGSERDLIDHGLIPAGPLDPYKSRLLLQFAVGAGLTRDETAAAFAGLQGS
jgi:L-asparaginase